MGQIAKEYRGQIAPQLPLFGVNEKHVNKLHMNNAQFTQLRKHR